MLQWLQQLRPQLHENQVLILDNARPHHARKVREYLADHPIRILFLPPYSPQMNPIEKLWAAIKQQWRQRRVRGFPQLRATLQADLEQIGRWSLRVVKFMDEQFQRNFQHRF